MCRQCFRGRRQGGTMVQHVERRSRRRGRCALCAALALAAATAEGDVPRLPPIVIPAPAPSEFDAPLTASALDADRIQTGQALVNLSEPLVGVPGVIANNRQNYAQDLQISIRGFGARSTFGLRGMRLYDDSIPAPKPAGPG